MFNVLLTGPYVPFTVAISLLLGLLALELVTALLGGSLLGLGADGDLDVDADIDLDVDVDFEPNLAPWADFEVGTEIDPDLDVTETSAAAETMGPAAWLGFGRVPVMIWIASLLLGFGLAGLILQSIASAMLAPLPAWVAIPPAGLAGLWFARGFADVFARALPKTESTALSERQLGRRVGVITQGTAKRGTPAEVKVTDRHGNLHYLRAEPLKDDDEIPSGTRVLVLRHQAEIGYRVVPLDDIA